MLKQILTKIKASRAAGIVTAMFMAVMVPSVAFADTGMTAAISTGVNGIVTDITSAVGVIVLVVLAVVGARVLFSLLKKA